MDFVHFRRLISTVGVFFFKRETSPLTLRMDDILLLHLSLCNSVALLSGEKYVICFALLSYCNNAASKFLSRKKAQKQFPFYSSLLQSNKETKHIHGPIQMLNCCMCLNNSLGFFTCQAALHLPKGDNRMTLYKERVNSYAKQQTPKTH